MELRLRWFNWCGEGPTRMRWIGEPGPGPAIPVTAPRCIDRSRPSRLMVEEIRRWPGGPAGRAGRIKP